MIQTKDLHIGYKKSLVRIENMKLEQGNVYVLLGKNGSGKSTFLKTLSGQLAPISGDCLLNGKSIVDFRPNELPQHMAFVSSKLEETDYLTVEDYISLARSPYTGALGTLNASDIAIIESSMKRMQIDGFRNRFISELSDGERQLVAITKALAQETDIILLDEPTAFLDYTNKLKVMQLLSEMAIQNNKCIIISTHDLDAKLTSNGTYLVIKNNEPVMIQMKSSSSKEELISVAY